MHKMWSWSTEEGMAYYNKSKFPNSSHSKFFLKREQKENHLYIPEKFNFFSTSTDVWTKFALLQPMLNSEVCQPVFFFKYAKLIHKYISTGLHSNTMKIGKDMLWIQYIMFQMAFRSVKCIVIEMLQTLWSHSFKQIKTSWSDWLLGITALILTKGLNPLIAACYIYYFSLTCK